MPNYGKRLPWYKSATREQRRNLQAESWRRNIEAELFRAAHTEGRESASDVIKQATKVWGRNPLGRKVNEPLREDLLGNVAPELQVGADFDRYNRQRAAQGPVPGVPRGVAEASPELAAGRRVYGQEGSTGEAGEVIKDIARDKPIVSDERLPGPARVLVEELTRPSNALIATGGPAAALRRGGRLGGIAAKVAEPAGRGFASRLLAEITASAGARTAVQETGERLPEGTNPIVGAGLQAAAGLVGGTGGAAAGARAPQAAMRFRDATQNIPVGASVRPEDELSQFRDFQRSEPQMGAPTEPPKPSVVERLTQVISAAKPLRSQTARLQSAERSRRSQAFGGIRTGASGEAAALRSRGALRGELPKLQFEAPRERFEQPDIDELFNINRDYNWGPRGRFDQATVDAALVKTLSGQVPTEKEITLLSKVYGDELANAVLSQRSVGQKIRENIWDIANIPRSLASTLDFSGLLRQGGFLLGGHPTRFAKTVPAYVRATFSPGFARSVDEQIDTDPAAQELVQAGLFVSNTTRRNLADRDEAFMSRFLTDTGLKSRLVKSGVGAGVGYATGDTDEERLRNAGIGAGAGFASPTLVKASERGYTTFLNKLRVDTAKDIMKNWDEDYKVANIDRLARFLNAATGRGDLKEVSKLGPALNAAFFSPRFLYSRFQLGAEGVRSIATPQDRLSRSIAKDTVMFVVTGLAAMKLMQLSGQTDVELDPRSSDFGKVKIGPTRYDFWGGYQQIARYTAQLLSGEAKTTTRGDIVDANRMETIGRFVQSKLAPTTGAAVDILRGETMMGEEVNASPESIEAQVRNRLGPLFAQDLQEAAEMEGKRGILKHIPAGFGIGVTSFKSNQDIDREVAEQMFPGVPMEQMTREQLRAVRQSPEVQERLDATSGPTRERAQQVYAQQESDDAQLQSGQMSLDEHEARRKNRNAEYSGFLLAQHGDELIQNPRNAYEEYLNVLRTSKDEGGQLQFEKVEEWLDAQDPERQAFIEARSGLSDTPYVAERRAVRDELGKAGFFDIRDWVWEDQKSKFKGKIKEEAEQFATYDEYRTELVLQLAERLAPRMEGGMDAALRRAEITVDNHRAISNYEKRLALERGRWAKSNQELARQAIEYGFLSPSKRNLNASGSVTKAGSSRQ